MTEEVRGGERPTRARERCAAPLTSAPPAVSGLNVPRSRRLFEIW